MREVAARGRVGAFGAAWFAHDNNQSIIISREVKKSRRLPSTDCVTLKIRDAGPAPSPARARSGVDPSGFGSPDGPTNARGSRVGVAPRGVHAEAVGGGASQPSCAAGSMARAAADGLRRDGPRGRALGFGESAAEIISGIAAAPVVGVDDRGARAAAPKRPPSHPTPRPPPPINRRVLRPVVRDRRTTAFVCCRCGR